MVSRTCGSSLLTSSENLGLISRKRWLTDLISQVISPQAVCPVARENAVMLNGIGKNRNLIKL